jgi:hypothetical protein
MGSRYKLRPTGGFDFGFGGFFFSRFGAFLFPMPTVYAVLS